MTKAPVRIPLHTLIALLLFGGMLVLAPVQAFSQAKVGAPAPTFTLTDLEGKERNLLDFQGQTVVLEWTNHECPYVRKHYDTENMQGLQKRYGRSGIVWLMINSSAPGKQGHLTRKQAIAQLEKENASPTAYLLDPTGKVGKLYGARTTPHMFIVDEKGILVYAGAIDDNDSSRHSSIVAAENYIVSALGQMKKGEPIKNASTEPYGCSVKYGG